MAGSSKSARRTPRAQTLPRGPYAISHEVVAADQRRRLLEAVVPVVAKCGFEDATVDRIVKIAAVKRNAFYEQFDDKRACVAAAYEIAQERLLGAITFQCYAGSGSAARLSRSLDAALGLLAAEPDLATLVLVEAPAAGEDLARRHHEWLDRYGRMLRFAVLDEDRRAIPSPGVEPAIVGGAVAQIKRLVLAGEEKRIPELGPELTSFMLSFYGAASPRRRFVDRPPPQPQSSEPAVDLVPGPAA